ncbi:GNAT family N-acetyltransferase [Kocuria palustris]|uniref:GNAT family N-acetyltransferase n=1 Tax=Kocuria palustris TaxID=71999 RepID=UPI0011A4E1FD|nr:GNAT family N-acetyltransferase [Kocuria palustris]
MPERARISGITVRPLEAAEAAAVLHEATLGNLNWQGPRFRDADVRERPEFAHYARLELGRGDFGVVAMPVSSRPSTEWAGAAWAVLLPPEDPGYGFAGPGIPEVSLHVRPAWRERRVGRLLLHELHEEARRRGLRALSLSVGAGNPARHLYESLGYRDAPGAAAGTMLIELGD